MESNDWVAWLGHWITQYQWLAGPLVFLIAFCESLAVVGVILPGVAMLFAVGVLLGQGLLPVYATLLWCYAGAICGDGISFALGYYYRRGLKRWRLFRRHPEWLVSGRYFFRRYGLTSIVLGRFVGPLRPIVPLVAGSMAMAPVRFYTINVLSALAWAPVYLLPGFMVGAAISLEHDISGRLLAWAGGLAALLWLWWYCWQRWPAPRLRVLCSAAVLVAMAAGSLGMQQVLPRDSVQQLWEVVKDRLGED